MENSKFLNDIVYENQKKKKLNFFLITILNSVLTFLFYCLIDRLVFYGAIMSEFIIMTIAVVVLGMFYVKKNRYIEKYGRKRGYNLAFYRYHVTAMPLIYVSAIHPLFVSHFQFDLNIFTCLLRLVGLYFILTGMVLHRKSIKIFGLDNLFMYYVYYPELGKKTESEIHKLLRHPIYSAMSRVSIGLGFLVGTSNSILCSLVLPLMQLVWLRVYEERDLLNRFNKEYKEYMVATPAIFVKITEIKKFWEFLMRSK